MDKEKKSFIISLIFNIVETIIIFMVGKIFKVETNLIIVLMLIFFLTRLLCGKPKHYATWYRCLVWSLLTFTSVYALTDLPLLATILLTIFTGYIATGRADITDLYQWKGKSTKNKDIEDYVKYNEFNDKLIEFETKLQQKDNLLFLLYKYRFKDHKSFTEISELLDDMPSCDISNKLDSIALSLRLYCGI